MDLSSSTESSDRVLQVSSGKTGETWLKNHAVKKRSLALLQQTCGVASDEENSGVETPIRSNSPPVQFQELSYNYKCELNSPRYVEYRRKQNKRNHTEERPQVWPDAVEEAFHDGMFRLCSSIIIQSKFIQLYGSSEAGDALTMASRRGRMN